MTERRQKVIAFLFGVLAALLMLEVSVRLIGGLYQERYASGRDRRRAGKRGHSVIVCLGNSFTAGSAMPKNKRYPEQLEHLFETRSPEMSVTVLNSGVNNANSAELLSLLKPLIAEEKPDLIVLRAGGPNLWNQHGYTAYLEREGISITLPKRFLLELGDFLYAKSRAYRMCEVLAHDLRTRLTNQPRGSSWRRLRKRIASAVRALRIATGTQKPKALFREKQSYRKAEEWLEEETAKWQAAADGTYSIDRKKAERALFLFKKGVEEAPYRPKNYELVAWTYFLLNDREESMRWFTEFARERQRRSNTTITNINAWRESDIREMVRIVREHGIGLVMQNYPPYWARVERPINAILREIAHEEEIPFVDNEKIFREEMERGTRYGDLFRAHDIFGHCNEKGYQIMAEGIYATITEKGMLGYGR
jgi:lysophospholipase L1-like esterase